jgi:hypothetical protein
MWRQRNSLSKDGLLKFRSHLKAQCSKTNV